MSATDTADNPGRIVFVISWLLFCIVWLVVGTRLATRWSLNRRFEGDDIATLVALVFSSGQTGAVTAAISNGLGQRMTTLSAAQISQFQQSVYASNLLNILTLCFAKIAVLLLLVQATPKESHLRISFGVGILIALWALTAVLTASFQCHLPHAWQFIGNQCFHLAAFWKYFAILNIITDLMLIALPTYILLGVRVEWHRKATIIACFASRFLVIVAAICQLVYGQQTYSSRDLTSDIWKETLCGQLVQNLSVITCCVPYLKPFYLGLESGLIRSDDLRRHGLVGAYGYGTHKSGQETAKNESYTVSATSDRHAIPKEVVSSNRDVELHNLTSLPGEAAEWEAGSGEAHHQSRDPDYLPGAHN